MADLQTMPMTSADGVREHLIDVTKGLPLDVRVFAALCGSEVLPATMTTPPGAPCAGCWQHLRAARERAAAPLYVLIPQQDRGHGRHRRPSRLHGLLGGAR